MFLLELQPQVEEHDDAPFYRGRICLGEFEEEFLAAAWMWERERYERQWRQAATRLVLGAPKAAFVTSFVHPDATNVIWPAWREGDLVYVRNQLLLRENRAGVLDPDRPEQYVGDRRTGSEDAAISEWVVRLADVVAFAA